MAEAARPLGETLHEPQRRVGHLPPAAYRYDIATRRYTSRTSAALTKRSDQLIGFRHRVGRRCAPLLWRAGHDRSRVLSDELRTAGGPHETLDVLRAMWADLADLASAAACRADAHEAWGTAPPAASIVRNGTGLSRRARVGSLDIDGMCRGSVLAHR
jgi:hypothetical protein